MKRINLHILFVVFAALFLLSGCESAEKYNSMPDNVARFVTQYFSGYAVESCDASHNGTTVILKNGPGLVFNVDGAWTSVDGFGLPLPEVFVFGQFPEKLYNYLSQTENTGNVYSVNRDGLGYRVRLLDSTVDYENESGIVTQN